jgi:hypothetical protein
MVLLSIQNFSQRFSEAEILRAKHPVGKNGLEIMGPILLIFDIFEPDPGQMLGLWSTSFKIFQKGDGHPPDLLILLKEVTCVFPGQHIVTAKLLF